MKTPLLLIYLLVFSCNNNFAQLNDSPFEILNNAIVDDFLVNDDSGNEHQQFPVISVDPTGTFVITWQDYRNFNLDIYFQRYISNGEALGNNKIVNDDTSDAAQGNPRISMDAAGNYVIVYADYRNNNYDIYLQRYTSTGAALGVNTKVNDDTDGTKQWYPSIAMDGAGNFVIVWIDERNGESDIYFQRYNSAGAPLGVNTKVNDDTENALQSNPSIAMDATGSFVIAWQDFRNSNWDIYFQSYSSTGTPIEVNTKVNDDEGSEFQYNSSISMDAAGFFIIAWQDFRNSNWDIFFQRFTNTGTTLGSNTRVNDDAGSEHQWLPSISINDIGDFVIVWEDDRSGQSSSKIFGQRYFSTGSPNGSNYRIVAGGSIGAEVSPIVFAGKSNIIFSWGNDIRSKGFDIYAKIVDWNWDGITAVLDFGSIIPENFTLFQNNPNPFNTTTKIKFEIPERIENALSVQLIIYNVTGNEVAMLVNEEKTAGEYQVEFDGSQFPSGTYYYQLRAENFIETKDMILIK